MKTRLTDIPKRYPLATLVCSLLLAVAPGAVASDSSLIAQLTATALSAVVALMLLSVFVPRLVRWRMPDAPSMLFAAALAAVGAVSFIATALFPAAFGLSFTDLSSTEIAGRLGVGALLCVATGVFEEALFRGLAMTCLLHRATADCASSASPSPPQAYGPSARSACKPAPASSAPVSFAALVSASLFALVHVVGTPPAEAASSGIVVAAQIVLKALQAGMFAYCMAALMVETRSIWLPVVAHAVFDLLYFAPTMIASAALPATYATGNCGDLVVLALTIAFLVPLCRKSRQMLRGEVLPYTSNPKSR